MKKGQILAESTEFKNNKYFEFGEVSVISQTLLNFLEYYFNIQKGLVFYLNVQNSVLLLEEVASLPYGLKSKEPKKFKLTEGLIGASFTHKKRIVMDDLPQDYCETSTGDDDSSITQLVCVPIYNESYCIGVIEIAISTPLNDDELGELERYAERLCAELIESMTKDKNDNSGPQVIELSGFDKYSLLELCKIS